MHKSRKKVAVQSGRKLRGDCFVLAAGREYRQNHQVGVGVEPLLSLLSGSFRGARDEAEVFAARERPQVLQTNSRQPRNFFFGEQFLARTNSDAHLASRM